VIVGGSPLLFGSKEVVTETFTADTTWVAPSGATNISTLYGIGADGEAAAWKNMGAVGNVVTSSGGCTGSTFGATLDYSTPYNATLVLQNAAQSWNTTGQTLSNFARLTFYRWCAAESEWRTSTIYSNHSVRRTGTVGLISNMPTSGTVPTSSIPYSFVHLTHIQYFDSANTGASTTGFGFTFVGGSIVASGVTHTNVPVTAGASYSLVVPAGGSITITYAAD
tara:strand:+ start:588 stop:1256 length:669 start_codon:yes stop_codon:yes gene_type:complete